MSDDKKLITINIDGVDCEVPAGQNIVDAAEQHGVEIPHYCYHTHLTVAGNCRMCLVELGMPMRDRGTGEPILDENGKPKIGFMPKPAIACATNAAPGMHIKTDTDMVKECQNGVMEFLLVNHPLDCPICDQAGECRLQEFATDYGRGYSRFVEGKNVKPKRTRLGPRVTLDDERCILCSRCIRFCQEIAEDDVLGFVDRGSYSTLACYPGRELNTNYSLNTVDICPVGALTSTDFRFKMRVWFLKPVKSICTESSVGVNIEVWSREGKIARITPRNNDEVNDSWMSDSGRSFFKTVDSEDRLTNYSIDGTPKSFEESTQAAADLLKSAKVAYVSSGHQSVEEQFMLAGLAKQTGGQVFLVDYIGHGDEKLISSDRTPNMRGALVTQLSTRLADSDLGGLAKLVDSGEVDTVLSCGEDLLKSGLTPEQLKKVKLIYIGTHAHGTSEKADVLFAGLTVFEKCGTFINQQFRIQKFDMAVPGPAGIRPGFQIMARLTSILKGEDQGVPSIDQAWKQISEKISELEGISYGKLSYSGQLIDGSAWANLPFCEGNSMHYEPKTREASVGA